jgi:hypothetical protein
LTPALMLALELGLQLRFELGLSLCFGLQLSLEGIVVGFTHDNVSPLDAKTHPSPSYDR